VRIVVVSGGNTLPSESVVSFVSDLDQPAPVDVITWGPPSAKLRRVCDRMVVLGPLRSPAEPVPAGRDQVPSVPLTGLTPARIKAAVLWRRRRAKRFARSKVARARSMLGRDRARTWRRIRRSAPAMQLLAEADLVVALDSQAIRAGWAMSRRQPAVAAVLGLASAQVAARRMAVARSAFDAEQVAGSG
jgi:hypothetical protein